MFNTPIIFLVFKRPAETSLVFERIRQAKPRKLLIVADGPRNEAEKVQTEKVRKIFENIDWPCEVKRNFSETNLGCRKRVWSGLDWAFEQVDQAIILEDDCLPDASFFPFCEEMLNKYKNDEKIMQVTGVNFQPKNHELESYYFSNIAQIWGWATWKRAWNKYDGHMLSWPTVKSNFPFMKVFGNCSTWSYWKYIFEQMSQNKYNTWDVAWTYTVFKEGGLCVVPNTNLVTNIGFDLKNATHGAKSMQLANVPTTAITFPLVHAESVTSHKQKDKFTYKKVFGINPTFVSEVKCYIKHFLRK